MIFPSADEIRVGALEAENDRLRARLARARECVEVLRSMPKLDCLGPWLGEDTCAHCLRESALRRFYLGEPKGDAVGGETPE